MGHTACTEPQCLYKGALYLYLTVELYLYSPYGPYGLYRASVPVHGGTLPYFYSYGVVEFKRFLKETLFKHIVDRAPNSSLKTSIIFRPLNYWISSSREIFVS